MIELGKDYEVAVVMADKMLHFGGSIVEVSDWGITIIDSGNYYILTFSRIAYIKPR